MMRYIMFLLLIVGCNSELDTKTVLDENLRLQKEVDSLKNELNKCDLILESYEGLPMGI